MNQQTEDKILTLLRAKKTALQIKEELGLVGTMAVYMVKYKYPDEFPKDPRLGCKPKEGGQAVRFFTRIRPETKDKIDNAAKEKGVTPCGFASGLLDDWGCS